MAGKTSPKPRKEPSAVVKYYLILYNVLQVLGWSYLLYQLISFYSKPPKDTTLWEHVKTTVVIFQNAAILEVFHVALGLVVSNFVLTAVQVASRVIVVCGVLLATPTAPLSMGLPLALFAWSITEVIRYSYYALHLLGSVPFFIIWCRYTFFIVLYPIGITGELLCIWAAYKHVSETGMWSTTLPNSVNFTFNYGYLLLGIMLTYIPGFPQLYSHMFVQRKKAVGGTGNKKSH